MTHNGELTVSFSEAEQQLRIDFPAADRRRIRAVLLAEWEASTGGVPLILPAEVVAGARDSLSTVEDRT